MRVALFEPAHSGHYLVYVNLIARGLVQADHQVILVSRMGVSGTAQFEEHLTPLLRTDANVEVVELASGTNRELLARLFALRADLVIIPNVDHLMTHLLVAAVRRRIRAPIIGLVMRPPMVSLRGGRVGAVKNAGKHCLIGLLRRTSEVRLVELAPANVDPTLVRAPDPVIIDTRADILWLKQALDEKLTWVGMVGVIAEWKNPLLVAQAVATLGRSCSVGLLIVGPVSQVVREDLTQLANNSDGTVVLIDRELSNGEFNAVIEYLEATVCAYTTHGPNSTVAKSVALGTKVVAAGSERYLANVRSVAPDAYCAELSVRSIAQAVLASTRDKGSPQEAPRLAAGSDFAQAFLLNVEDVERG